MRKLLSYIGYLLLILVVVFTTYNGVIATETSGHSRGSKQTTEITTTDITQKEEIHFKMLNTIDYFKTVKGSFTYKSENSGANFTVDYMIKNDENPASFKKLTDNRDKSVVIKKNDGDFEVVKNEKDKSYVKYKLHKAENSKENIQKDFKSRYKKNEQGENVSYFRPDPTFMGEASNSIFPQEIAFSFLNDYSRWNIVGEEMYNKYDALIIEGTLDEYFQEKLKSNTFRLIVQKETGILLNAEVFNTNNDIMLSISTNDIKINGEIDNSQLNSNEPVGYKKKELFKKENKN